MHNYYEQVDFLNGGKVAHQQEVRYQDQDQLPQETEKTLKILDQELAVDEEYKEAFEIARRLLKFYKSENAIRNGQYFAGAALYFGFRCKNAPYLLIEISEFIKKDSATKVAKCYLKLLKFVKADAKAPQIVQLAKSLQYLDPSIYIPKFVRLLEISRDKYKAIVDTAMKLIKRMMLDWMAYGRRPSSLCGAALLISARFHGENVPTSQVCKTVQVCDETIRKRLAEFNQTGLSQLTREQFEQIENIETGIPGPVNDPPSYRRIKQQEEEMRKGLTEEEIKQLEESTLKKALEMIELLKVQPEVYKQEDNLKQEYPIPVKEPIKEQKDNEILSSLSELDEQEYILNEQEKANKQIVWSALNKEYRLFEFVHYTFMILNLKIKKRRHNRKKICQVAINNRRKKQENKRKWKNLFQHLKNLWLKIMKMMEQIHRLQRSYSQKKMLFLHNLVDYIQNQYQINPTSSKLKQYHNDIQMIILINILFIQLQQLILYIDIIIFKNLKNEFILNSHFSNFGDVSNYNILYQKSILLSFHNNIWRQNVDVFIMQTFQA